MKKLLALTLALLLAALPMASLAEDTALSATGNATISVTGSASVVLDADYAQVHVGVSTLADTVQAASEENAVAIRAVIDALLEAGIPQEDIATSNFSVHAQYDYSAGRETVVGYNVSNQLVVVLRDMTCIGATLDKAILAGANNVYSIEFLSTKSAEAQDEASVHAVHEATRKARLLAAAAGLTLGDVVSISDATASWNISAKTFTASSRDMVSNVILPDDLSVSASVTIVFELK